jgi:plasmid stabilization system protein ParE
MGWSVVFSPRSHADLGRIVKYIARDDPAAAERFGMALIAQAARLCLCRIGPGELARIAAALERISIVSSNASMRARGTMKATRFPAAGAR